MTITYSYQWNADGVAIPGATAQTLMLTDTEIGAIITATVSATNAGGSTNATSLGIGPVTAAGGDTYFATITIASGKVTTDLTNFPVMVRLSGMPASFWSRVKADGGDIRVKTSGGALVPMDLARFDYYDRDGVLFFKAASVLAASANTWEIHYGDPALNLLPVANVNGRNAVWSDYATVLLFGETSEDRTGGTLPFVGGDPDFFEVVETSPDVDAHQGVCSDGIYYYVTDTNAIRKYDLSWNLVASNLDPIGATGLAVVNHLGDLDVHDGKLYIPIEFFAAPSTHSNEYIAVFSASDLSFVQAFNVSAQGKEVSSIAYCPADGLLYVTDYTNGTFLNKYDLTTGAFVGALTLTASDGASLTGYNWQGITWWRGAFWLSSDAFDETYRTTYAGVVQSSGLFGKVAAAAYEGIGHIGDSLLQLIDDGAPEYVLRLKPRSISKGAGGGALLVGAQEHVIASGRPSFTTFTLGVTASWSDKSQSRAIASYWDNGVDNVRATIGYRSSTTEIGFWDNVNSWTLSSPTLNPTLNQVYRIHGVVNGTTHKRLYVDGVQKGQSAPISAVSSALDTLLIGREDASNLEAHRGLVGFAYLRGSALSADWIAAEYSNLNAPGSFYGIGTEQVGPEPIFVLSISGTPVLTATKDVAYAGFAVSATYGTAPYTFSIASGALPAGLTLNSSTGAVSGTPTETGSFANIVIRVTDAALATDDLAAFTIEVAGASFGTLNPADRFPDITLSNGNLTATKTTGGTAWASVRSTTSRGSGKHYYEWTPNKFSGSFIAAGFSNAAAALSNYIGQDVNGIVLLTNGSVYKGAGGTATLPALAEGNIIGFAIDLDNDLFWCRNGTGNWNGSPTANPATGVGGITLPSGLTSGNVYAGLSLQSNNDAGKANFGATPFAHTQPAGFAAWG